jgi:hypothetical protein
MRLSQNQKNRVGNSVGFVRRGSRTALNQGAFRSAPTVRICPEAILRHFQMPVPPLRSEICDRIQEMEYLAALHSTNERDSDNIHAHETSST